MRYLIFLFLLQAVICLPTAEEEPPFQDGENITQNYNHSIPITNNINNYPSPPATTMTSTVNQNIVIVSSTGNIALNIFCLIFGLIQFIYK